MQTSESIKELAPALAAAQAEFSTVGKSGNNTHDRYKYAKLEDFVDATKDVLAQYGFAIITSVDNVTPIEGRTTNSGSAQYACYVHLTVRIIHKSGEWLEAGGVGEGQDRADKGLYKAITGARKYALAAMLGLKTGDDPEADETVGVGGNGKAKSNGRSQPAAANDSLI